jgi:hypothetical protein
MGRHKMDSVFSNTLRVVANSYQRPGVHKPKAYMILSNLVLANLPPKRYRPTEKFDYRRSAWIDSMKVGQYGRSSADDECVSFPASTRYRIGPRYSVSEHARYSFTGLLAPDTLSEM